MTWTIPGKTDQPAAATGRIVRDGDLSASVRHDRALRANRFRVFLAMVRSGFSDLSPGRAWRIDPADYGAVPAAGTFPFRVIEGAVVTAPMPLPGSDGRMVGTGAQPGAMMVGSQGRFCELRVTLTDLETSATNSVVRDHGVSDDITAPVPLPVGTRSGNRIRIDVDARWTHASNPARVNAVVAWWGACTDVRALSP